jgi:hypothetical protein
MVLFLSLIFNYFNSFFGQFKPPNNIPKNVKIWFFEIEQNLNRTRTAFIDGLQMGIEFFVKIA